MTDTHNNLLQNVTIIMQSSGQIFHTGTYGDFGIMSAFKEDTLTFSLDGYETEQKAINASEYLKVILKPKPSTENLRRNHLTTFIKDLKGTDHRWKETGETYSTLIENPFVSAYQSPQAVFSPNTNKASYSNIRRFINMRDLVPPDAVRIEEMLNYFNLKYTEPAADEVFHCSSELTSCPWSKTNQLLYLNISARKVDMRNVPPSNLVILLDISGSMDMPNKLPLIKSGLRLLVNNLRPVDTISIVTYGSQVSLLLDGTSGTAKKIILDTIESLQAAGSTPGEAGLKLAYKVARRRLNKEGNNRIILATDGDFNVGHTEEKDLEELIDRQKQYGIYLSCLGVGMGNYKDSKLYMLAQKGHGNFSYIDNEKEAEKVFVSELTQTLYTVADNVSVSVNFNPQAVKDYRLIGFENKKRAMNDTSSKIEGGEIGSGQALMAIFELAPVDMVSNAQLSSVTINYQLPHQQDLLFTTYEVRNKLHPFDEADTSWKQAATIAMFGMKLRQSGYASRISWKSVLHTAYSCFSRESPMGSEFLNLLERAKIIYRHKRK